MRTNLFLLTLTASTTLLLSSCGSKATTEAAAAPAAAADTSATAPASATASYYTCEMHPEIHSDKPGKCPKCGMNLVKK